ncbi:hypothetical protein B0H12DRAFT_372017 [Mycena haematopus]|nr:hypothetical protein B0H12DRAFT_372017 [Mycena haematopus]
MRIVFVLCHAAFLAFPRSTSVHAALFRRISPCHATVAHHSPRRLSRADPYSAPTLPYIPHPSLPRTANATVISLACAASTMDAPYPPGSDVDPQHHTSSRGRYRDVLHDDTPFIQRTTFRRTRFVYHSPRRFLSSVAPKLRAVVFVTQSTTRTCSISTSRSHRLSLPTPRLDHHPSTLAHLDRCARRPPASSDHLDSCLFIVACAGRSLTSTFSSVPGTKSDCRQAGSDVLSREAQGMCIDSVLVRLSYTA